MVHPAALVDMDGDGIPEAIVETDTAISICRIDASGPTLVATVSVPPGEQSFAGMGSTAFDFRGHGSDWLAAARAGFKLFAGVGPASLFASTPLENIAPMFFPVVADIDNDGSADVVVFETTTSPRGDVVAYEDMNHRPSPARRIWNQWNYVASDVREDARLPPPGSPRVNTFRVQSRLDCASSVPH